MKSMRVVALCLLALVVLLLLAGWWSDFFAIDKCLDTGGAWDYAVARCRH